ncbi:MAG: hypothetical protein V4662_14005 [Verrucomicrobiota bacterium]
MPSSTDPEVIASGLKALRRRRLIVNIICILYFPGMFALLMVPDDAVELAIGVGFLPLIFCSLSLLISECPRCGEWFHTKGWLHKSFTRECLHCQLPLDQSAPKGELMPRDESHSSDN